MQADYGPELQFRDLMRDICTDILGTACFIFHPETKLTNISMTNETTGLIAGFNQPFADAQG